MIVYLHIPKTAGSTFQLILENSFGISHLHTSQNRREVFDRKDFDFARKFFPTLRSIGGGNLINPLELNLPDPFYVTFLREPVARVFSHYQHMVRSGCQASFEETLVSEPKFQNLHVKMMSGGTDLNKAKLFLDKCGVAGMTEKFELSLHLLGKLSPYPFNLNYRRKQVAPDNAVKKKLESDPRAVELTREHNKLDLELYAYAVNEVFPRICAKAGVNPSDKVPSHEVADSANSLGYRMSGFYNKIFRQVYKVRHLGGRT